VKRSAFVSAFAAALWVAAAALAQYQAPQLNSIFPCGGRQGTTVECTIGGGELNGASGLYFSHPDLKAEPAGPNKFKVTIPESAPLGRYDVRVVCPLGLSSCRSFVVGDRAEFVEKEPNNVPENAERMEMPAVVNGQVSGSVDVDCFVFSAKKGQRVLVNCWAWRIDSRLDGTLMVFDPQGKEIGYGGDFYGKDPFVDFTAAEDGDYTVKIWDFIFSSGTELVYRLEIGSQPHLDAVVPSAVVPGQSNTITLFGRNLPGGQPAPADMNVQGKPLEFITQVFSVDADSFKAASLHGGEALRPPQVLLDGTEYRLTTSAGSSNPLLIGFAAEPVVMEQEPNNDATASQRVTIPCEVSGTFSPVGDLDYYTFAVKKGDRITVDLYGERQSGLTDPVLNSFDATGKRITSGDDFGRNIGQLRFTTTTRDPRWDFTASADGEYTVQVRDLYHQQRGDPRLTYRLSVRQLKPDFRLVAAPTAEVQPDCTTVRRGGRYWIDVLAWRNDGFEDPIIVTAENLPPGVSSEPVTIGPGRTSAPLVFTAAADAPIGHAEIRIVGKAKIGETEVVRHARSGGLVWSTVNTPGIARIFDSILLAVREPAPFSITAKAVSAEVAAGGKLPIHVQLTRAADWNEDVQLSGFDLPQQAVFPLTTIKKGATEATAELSLPANIRPGQYSFIVHGSGQIPKYYSIETEPAKRGTNIRGVLPSNAVTINVVPAAK